MVSISSGQIKNEKQITKQVSLSSIASILPNNYTVKCTNTQILHKDVNLNSLSMPIRKRQVTIIEPDIINKYKMSKGVKKVKKETSNNVQNKDGKCIFYSFLKIAVIVSLVSGTVFYVWKK